MNGQGGERLENEIEFKIGEKQWGKGREGKGRCVRKRKSALTNAAEERFHHLGPQGGTLWTFFPHQNKKWGREEGVKAKHSPNQEQFEHPPHNI